MGTSTAVSRSRARHSHAADLPVRSLRIALGLTATLFVVE